MGRHCPNINYCRSSTEVNPTKLKLLNPEMKAFGFSISMLLVLWITAMMIAGAFTDEIGLTDSDRQYGWGGPEDEIALHGQVRKIANTRRAWMVMMTTMMMWIKYSCRRFLI